jgi:hypothetical protein
MNEDPTYEFVRGVGWIPSGHSAQINDLFLMDDGVTIRLQLSDNPEVGGKYIKIIKDRLCDEARIYRWWNKDGSYNIKYMAQHFSKFSYRGWSVLEAYWLTRKPIREYYYYELVPV